MRIKTASIFPMLALAVGTCFVQQKNVVEGVWELTSQKFAGKENTTGSHFRQWKIITRKHWMWAAQDTGAMSSLLSKKTLRDSLQASYEVGGGAGSYTLVGNTYTETIEFFPDPHYLGVSIPFTVKVAGDRLFQSGTLPPIGGDKDSKGVLLEETYKRLE